MAYTKTVWENAPSTNTPINSTNLNHIEQGIYDNSLGVEKIGDLTNLETTSKTTCVSAINELKEGLDDKQDAFIIENVTIASSVTINGNDSKVYVVPDKAGYTAYVLKPYVGGGWSDKFAVYVPYSDVNRFGIRNVSGTNYTWQIYCAVLYIKNSN